MRNHRTLFLLLLLFALAFSSRLAYFLIKQTYMDLRAAEMERAAICLADHGELGNAYSDDSGPTAHVSPLYPAFLAATDDEDVHHEAEIEHEGAKRLIADIEASGPDDDYYDARVTVLSGMIKHHVNEEEKRDGMFSKARKADMDLVGLGQQLEARKSELISESEGDNESGVRRARGSEAQARA